MAYITMDRCPICSDDEKQAHHAKIGVAPQFTVALADDFVVNAGAVAVYSHCGACGVYYQNPRMDDKQVEAYYTRGIYRATLNTTDEYMDRDELIRAKIDTHIFRDLWGADWRPATHLDIGASRGYLLHEVGAEHQYAVEPTAGRILYDDIIQYRTLDDADDGFDIVTLIHSLEHEPRPVAYLERCAARLNDGGKLVVEVPSWNSQGGPLRLAHLYHWAGVDEFATTAKLAGLRIVQHITTPHNMFILEVEP